MDNRFSRAERILGSEALNKLNSTSVIVFGIGGVGSSAAEALVRGGIGKIALVDKDIVDITNINRQLIATDATIGMNKTDAAEKRLSSINPQLVIKKYNMFYLPENACEIDLKEYDFIIDAIDNVTAKIELITRAQKEGVPIVSSMGTGNKIHPEMLKLTDIYKTNTCPLARVMRRELKNRGIKKLTVVYSEEEPIKTASSVPGSVSYTPPVAGYLLASYVINSILDLN